MFEAALNSLNSQAYERHTFYVQLFLNQFSLNINNQKHKHQNK